MSTHEEDAAMSDAPTSQTPTRSTPERDPSDAEQSTTDETDETSSDAAPDTLSDDVLKNPGRRVTANLSHLVIEAELAAEGKDLDNPAVPDQTVIEDAIQQLERRDLEPAWIACRGEDDD
jgi:hypothetical protein